MSDLIDNAQNVRRWLDEKGQHEKADAVSALVIAYQTLKNAKPAEQQEATCKQSLQVAAATKAGGDEPVAYTYASTQATKCAGCGEHKHTPLRIDAMGGYVCLTCIDKKLGGLLGEFGYTRPQPQADD